MRAARRDGGVAVGYEVRRYGSLDVSDVAVLATGASFLRNEAQRFMFNPATGNMRPDVARNDSVLTQEIGALLQAAETLERVATQQLLIVDQHTAAMVARGLHFATSQLRQRLEEGGVTPDLHEGSLVVRVKESDGHQSVERQPGAILASEWEQVARDLGAGPDQLRPLLHPLQ